MQLNVYPSDLNEKGKELSHCPESKEYFLPSVQVIIEQVRKAGGRVIYYSCDRYNGYSAVVK